MQDLFTNTFPLDGKIKLSVAGVSEINIEETSFHLTEIKFILAGIRFCIINLFLQDTATVPIHKGFLKDISTRQKICFNKDFLIKLFRH